MSGILKDDDLVSLEAVVQLAVQYRAVRVKLGDIEVELHPSAFAAPPTAASDKADVINDVCRCGHSLSVEHNETGCLLGCPESVCAPASEE
jgi:hypothetical protein